MLEPQQPQSNAVLPRFPHFVHLGANHQAALAELVASEHIYSDYNFISLWSWDHQNQLQLSVLNDNLVIRFQDYQNPHDYFFSFLGSNQTDATAKTLLEYSAAQGKTELKLVPDFVVKSLEHPEAFTISEDRDNFDYIVAIKEMVELPGSEHESKRWSLNHFLQRHSDDLTIKELDIREPKTREHLWELTKFWSTQVKDKDSYNESELSAIRRLLDEHHTIGTDRLHIVGLYLGDKLKGYSISEVLDGGFAVGHYKKSDRNYRGLGVAVEHYTAKSLEQKGVSHMNHEQDLGIEGLRKAKLAHNPVYFLKKYTIALKQ